MYFFDTCLTISKAGETLGKHLYQYPPKSPDFSNFIINNLFFHFFFISFNILYFNNLAFAYPELAPACPSNISIKFLIFINFYVSISYVILFSSSVECGETFGDEEGEEEGEEEAR